MYEGNGEALLNAFVAGGVSVDAANRIVKALQATSEPVKHTGGSTFVRAFSGKEISIEQAFADPGKNFNVHIDSEESNFTPGSPYGGFGETRFGPGGAALGVSGCVIVSDTIYAATAIVSPSQQAINSYIDDSVYVGNEAQIDKSLSIGPKSDVASFSKKDGIKLKQKTVISKELTVEANSLFKADATISGTATLNDVVWGVKRDPTVQIVIVDASTDENGKLYLQRKEMAFLNDFGKIPDLELNLAELTVRTKEVVVGFEVDCTNKKLVVSYSTLKFWGPVPDPSFDRVAETSMTRQTLLTGVTMGASSLTQTKVAAYYLTCDIESPVTTTIVEVSSCPS